MSINKAIVVGNLGQLIPRFTRTAVRSGQRGRISQWRPRHDSRIGAALAA